LLHSTDVGLAAFNEPQRQSLYLCDIAFEREVAKRVTEAARRRLLRCPRQLRHDRPMFTVGRSYELTFFTGSSKATASLKVTVLDFSLPLIMVRDEKDVELVINTSSAGFVSAKAMKEQGTRW
jgi:hypothetical protein